MARVVDAKYSTFVGTPKQIRATLDELAGRGSAVIDAKWSNFVPTAKPLTTQQIYEALRISPERRER